MTTTRVRVSGVQARPRSAHIAAPSRRSCKETLTRRCASRPRRKPRPRSRRMRTPRTWALTNATRTANTTKTAAHAATTQSRNPRRYAFKRTGRGPLPGAKQLRRLAARRDPSPACRALELQRLIGQQNADMERKSTGSSIPNYSEIVLFSKKKKQADRPAPGPLVAMDVRRMRGTASCNRGGRGAPAPRRGRQQGTQAASVEGCGGRGAARRDAPPSAWPDVCFVHCTEAEKVPLGL